MTLLDAPRRSPSSGGAFSPVRIVRKLCPPTSTRSTTSFTHRVEIGSGDDRDVVDEPEVRALADVDAVERRRRATRR